jgi:hypothetical protein
VSFSCLFVFIISSERLSQKPANQTAPSSRVGASLCPQPKGRTVLLALRCGKKKKPPEGASPQIQRIAGRSKRNPRFALRRYATKPMPAKPSTSIAHVNASGMALTIFTSSMPTLHHLDWSFEARVVSVGKARAFDPIFKGIPTKLNVSLSPLKLTPMPLLVGFDKVAANGLE